ncbi:MAG: hypothetical protein AAFN93_04740 [Bacteroidota bacterium]
MKLLYTISFLLISTYGSSQNNWKLVYENDADGKTVTGDLEDLITSVRSGKSLKVYFKMGRPSQPEVYVEHTALVKFTTVMNSPEGQYVTGQIDPIVGQVPNFKKGQVQLKENLEWSMIASTNGSNDTMTRNVITGEIVDHRFVRWGTKWFVKE